MTIQIDGDSLHFKLAPEDITHLLSNGMVRDEAAFSATAQLSYGIRAAKSITQISASMDKNAITVELPLQIVTRWANSDQTGISTEQDAGNRRVLKILIEKK